MRYPWLLVVVGCLFACSSPPPHKRSHATRTSRPRFVVASDDHAHPQQIALDYHVQGTDEGTLDARAPRAGTWWYVVEVPDLPGKLSRIKLSTLYAGAPGVLAFAWVDDAGIAHPAVDHVAPPWISLIELPETAEPERSLLLRVTTTEAVDFNIAASRWWRDQPRAPDPPCDRDHIDASNQNCEGVYPRCEPNNPDFTNPSCCQARCIFDRRSCRGKIVGGRGAFVRISLGAADEIMKYARGELVQDTGVSGNLASDVVVWDVAEHDSLIQILEPKQVDLTNLGANTYVILSAPEQCRRR